MFFTTQFQQSTWKWKERARKDELQQLADFLARLMHLRQLGRACRCWYMFATWRRMLRTVIHAMIYHVMFTHSLMIDLHAPCFMPCMTGKCSNAIAKKRGGRCQSVCSSDACTCGASHKLTHSHHSIVMCRVWAFDISMVMHAVLTSTLRMYTTVSL